MDDQGKCDAEQAPDKRIPGPAAIAAGPEDWLSVG